MRSVIDYLSSSIGKKQLVALSGLLLCGFLAAHLAGNLLLLKGMDAFNHYAELLTENPLLPVAEVALAALFLLHIALGLFVSWRNYNARPEAYETRVSAGGRTPGSATMKYTGLFTLVFLIVHVWTFRFGEDEGPGGLFGLVMEWFQNGMYAGFYVLAMTFLGLHLSHGFQSAFQTLGVNHPRYTPLIKAAGIFFALACSLGLGVLPLWSHFIGG
ncbi:MAG: succinate dehydrogenase cytochrome b subunit [Elusimicrobiota bacterium]